MPENIWGRDRMVIGFRTHIGGRHGHDRMVIGFRTNIRGRRGRDRTVIGFRATVVLNPITI
jgi:hypothetical protein